MAEHVADRTGLVHNWLKAREKLMEQKDELSVNQSELEKEESELFRKKSNLRKEEGELFRKLGSQTADADQIQRMLKADQCSLARKREEIRKLFGSTTDDVEEDLLKQRANLLAKLEETKGLLEVRHPIEPNTLLRTFADVV